MNKEKQAGSERFNRIIRMASRLLDVPFVLLSLYDKSAGVFRNRCSLGITTPDHQPDGSFGQAVWTQKSTLVLSDASRDERFSRHVSVTGEPHVRFFAGQPLYAPDGEAVGALCVMDNMTRSLTPAQIEILRELAAMAEFELSADQFYTIDATTGLANRRGFEILASHSLAICQRQGLRATLLHIDLEGFGAINAERGTAFADELLRIVGEEVTSVFRESDSLGRVGPDEFAALLTDTAPEQVEVVLSRLHAALREAGQELDSEFSLNFGYASVEYAPGRHAALPMLLAEAESSLHESVLA